MNDTPKTSTLPAEIKQPVAKPQTGAETQRGLLDLSVELSTREMTAGEEFALYVLVKNPFTHPVRVDSVHLSLPSELIHPKKEDLHRQIQKNVDAQIEEIEKDREFYKASLARIEKRLPATAEGGGTQPQNGVRRFMQSDHSLLRSLESSQSQLPTSNSGCWTLVSTYPRNRLKNFGA
jgi:hypothetical protein